MDEQTYAQIPKTLEIRELATRVTKQRWTRCRWFLHYCLRSYSC